MTATAYGIKKWVSY